MQELLESGKVLLFSHQPFSLLSEEFSLLTPALTDSSSKNISYNGREIRGATAKQPELTALLKRFSEYANTLIRDLFPSYLPSLQQGRTSLRCVEIEGRVSSYRKDDTRLHVDAFPSSPNQGRRILRVFSNINPHGVDRVWRIGESFESVAKTFLPKIPQPIRGSAWLLKQLRVTKSLRTPYDHYMLHIHDRMKEDMDYQKNVSQTEMRFSPGSTWIVQTDQVSHAAMSGQHMLEQTFYLPVSAMRNPEKSPLKILEKLLGCPLI